MGGHPEPPGGHAGPGGRAGPSHPRGPHSSRSERKGSRAGPVPPSWAAAGSALAHTGRAVKTRGASSDATLTVPTLLPGRTPGGGVAPRLCRARRVSGKPTSRKDRVAAESPCGAVVALPHLGSRAPGTVRGCGRSGDAPRRAVGACVPLPAAGGLWSSALPASSGHFPPAPASPRGSPRGLTPPLPGVSSPRSRPPGGPRAHVRAPAGAPGRPRPELRPHRTPAQQEQTRDTILFKRFLILA